MNKFRKTQLILYAQCFGFLEKISLNDKWENSDFKEIYQIQHKRMSGTIPEISQVKHLLIEAHPIYITRPNEENDFCDDVFVILFKDYSIGKLTHTYIPWDSIWDDINLSYTQINIYDLLRIINEYRISFNLIELGINNSKNPAQNRDLWKKNIFNVILLKYILLRRKHTKIIK